MACMGSTGLIFPLYLTKAGHQPFLGAVLQDRFGFKGSLDRKSVVKYVIVCPVVALSITDVAALVLYGI